MTGRLRRMNRLFIGRQKRCLLSPLDHAGWLGPVRGLDNPRKIVQQVIAGGANAILASPGFIREVAPILPNDTAVVLRLSITAGLSAAGTQETPAASLDTALRMDADAVAVSVFFGRDGDIEIYRWLAELIGRAQPYEMPVVAEMIPPQDRLYEADAIAHAARIGMEIGADVIKTYYCGSVDGFHKVVESSPVPIIIAGGPQNGDISTIEMVREAMASGAAGVAIGRRVWQSDDPEGVTRQIAEVLWG